MTKTFAEYYNQFGYMAQVARITGSGSTTNAQVLWQATSQDAADRVLQAILGNGLSVKRDYYPYSERLQDTYLSNPSTNGTMLLQEGYQYDVLGNVQIRTEYWNNSQSGFSETFGYDAMNRLSTSQVTTNSNTSTQTFTYDAIGDIITKTGVGTGNYSYPTQGANSIQPHAVQSIAGLTGSFQYDANGNMTSDPYGRSNSWNSFDMPYKMSMGSGTSSQFNYGPEHQRTRQNRGDGSIIVYAGAMEIVMQSGNSTVKTYWPSGLGVEIDAPGASSTALNWTHTDNLGSVVAITNQTGALVQSMAYDPWGSRRDLAADAAVLHVDASGNLAGQPLVDNKGFTDQEELDQLNLVHLNGRVYDPLLGRFLSADPEIQDPTHSQSYNRYTYVWNNPTNFTDPTGFSCNDPQGGGDCEITGHPLTAPQAAKSAENGMFAIVAGAVIRYAIANPQTARPVITRMAIGGGLEGGPAVTKILGTALLAEGAFEIWLANKKADEQAGADKGALNGNGSAAGTGAPDPNDPEKDKKKDGKKTNKPERTEHAEQRAEEAKSDAHRNVGDANRVINEGTKLIDNDTGNTVHVLGDRVVITDEEGDIVTQFKNTRANTQQRLDTGRWSFPDLPEIPK